MPEQRAELGRLLLLPLPLLLLLLLLHTAATLWKAEACSHSEALFSTKRR